MSHLKEEDHFVDFLLSTIRNEVGAAVPGQPPPLERALARVQDLVEQHRAAPADSELRRLLPHMGRLYVPLDLVGALREYDAGSGICARRFVPPSFRELREVLNLATAHAVARDLRLVTLDADDTLYPDGATLTPESPMVPLIVKLLRMGVCVSLVTAASYPGEPHKMEARIATLLRALAFALEAGAHASILSRFWVVGGECNYLLHPVASYDGDGLSPSVSLREVPDAAWKDGRGVRWSHRQVDDLLDAAEGALRAAAGELNLDVLVIRKPRAVGIVPRPMAPGGGGGGGAARYASGRRVSYETLEEVALRVQHTLGGLPGLTIPYTAFNGGQDVFIDVGDKSLGIRAIQALVGATPAQTVHAGDRFTRTGNDLRARDVASTLWVTGPAETEYLLTLVIADVRAHRAAAGVPAIAPPEDAAPAITKLLVAQALTPVGSEPGESDHTPVVLAGSGAADEVGSRPFTPPGTVSPAAVAAAVAAAAAGGGPHSGPDARPFSFHVAAKEAGDDAAAVGGAAAGRPPRPAASTQTQQVAAAMPPGAFSYVGTTITTPTLAPVDASSTAAAAQLLQLSELSLDEAPPSGAAAAAPLMAAPPPPPLDLQQLHAATGLSSALAGGSSVSDGGAGAAVDAGSLPSVARQRSPSSYHGGSSASSGGGHTPVSRGVTASPRAVPAVYGMTSARALQDLKSRAADDIRSQWQSAGGAVVGEVRPTTPVASVLLPPASASADRRRHSHRHSHPHPHPAADGGDK